MEGTGCKQSVQGSGQCVPRLAAFQSILQAAVGSWWFGDFFFFQWTEAERSMGTFFAFPGVGESLFSLS